MGAEVTLGEFLEQAAEDRGPWNCSTMPADWCIALGHPDFAAEWREITDPVECEAVPDEAGGLLALWERGIGASLPNALPPYQAGDIAVVSGAGLKAGAIFTGDKWVLRTSRGVGFARLSDECVIKAWRP